ncbi:MAG: hypothetical protein FWD61_09535 [Phycisphaerales bacterium]|nr:hypothetical protein [Phycisphaerales bacterium]
MRFERKGCLCGAKHKAKAKYYPSRIKKISKKEAAFLQLLSTEYVENAIRLVHSSFAHQCFEKGFIYCDFTLTPTGETALRLHREASVKS